MTKKTKKHFLIEWYPVEPNIWFRVRQMAEQSSVDRDVFEEYRERLERRNAKPGEFFGWNNRWWLEVDACTVQEAINKFFKIFLEKS